MSSTLNITQDEMNRFKEAMKKEEFRKLLVDYMEEISDPKNRELYEQEITNLEEERGIDVVFIHPEPGYCIKTFQDDGKKVFINICKNSNIQKPSTKRDLNNNKNGLYWTIPHSCSPVREDFDKNSNELCQIYDVVFHPDAYRMGETCQRFNNLLKDSAIETIEKNFNLKIDKKKSKILKSIKFKGKPNACVIRKLKNESDSFDTTKLIQNPVESIADQLKREFLNNQSDSKNLKEKKVINQNESAENKFVEPIYKIIYSNQSDIQDYSNHISTNFIKSTRPKEIKISIELPKCKSSADLILDIFDKRIYLESSHYFYKLDLNLSYPVNEKESKAKFDKSKKVLNVSLPVIPFNLKKEEHLDDFNELTVEETDKNSTLSNISSSVSNVKADASDISQDIKYLMPLKYEIVRLNGLLRISILEENYDENSIKVQFSNNSLVLNYECISKSGTYLNYFKGYFLFLKNDNIFIFPNSNQHNLNPIEIRKLNDKIEIDISNDDDNNGEINCIISSEEIKELNKTSDSNTEIFKIYNIKKEPEKSEIDHSNKNPIFEKELIFDNNSDDENSNFQHIDQENQDDEIDSSTYKNRHDNENFFSSSSINGKFLKGILKKSRSSSEGEESVRNSFESNEGSLEMCSIKKNVSFSKQIVRNIFKPGSTIAGMKKPNSLKNKKKNQKRNRTLSDPCHFVSEISDNLITHQNKFRQRVLSESSCTNSTDTITKFDNFLNVNNKKNNQEEIKNEFDLEKMIQIKSKGEKQIDKQYKNETTCAFKFRNKITELLD